MGSFVPSDSSTAAIKQKLIDETLSSTIVAELSRDFDVGQSCLEDKLDELRSHMPGRSTVQLRKILEHAAGTRPIYNTRVHDCRPSDAHDLYMPSVICLKPGLRRER